MVVWKLDRLSRSLRDVLILMETIQRAKAGFKSLTEAIDTRTPAGRMMMQMVGSFAEFEREMLRECTCAGLQAARKQGRIGGAYGIRVISGHLIVPLTNREPKVEGKYSYLQKTQIP